MKNKQLFDKAYSRLMEIYGGEDSTPDIAILSRFYWEKMILCDSELYMRYLDFLSRVRVVAKQKGEHIFVRGPVGSSFIAYLLGATDINPLPRHEYCPHCRTTKFVGTGTPFDKASIRCPCGTDVETDGHNLPFESNLKSVFSERIQFCVSRTFFDEAKAMIYDELWDKSIVTLTDGEISSTWFCILDKDTNACGDYVLNGNREIFEKFPRITLVPDEMLDKYRELEKSTGFQMEDVGFNEQSLAFFHFMECDIQGVPHFDNGFIKDIWNTINPRSYDDLLKLIGFAHSTNVWGNNSDALFNEHRMSLREIPAFREDLYEMISERLCLQGVHDKGFAYEVTDKAMRGYYAKTGGVDEDTMSALLNVGFDMDFIYFLSDINYMFTKAQGVAYLRDAIAMMFYKIKFNKEYNEIILGKQNGVLLQGS